MGTSAVQQENIRQKNLWLKPYIPLPELISSSRNIGFREKVVLSVMLDYVKEDYPSCRPYQDTLARRAGTTRTNIVKALRVLSQKKIVEQHHSGKASSYSFHLDNLATQASSGVSSTIENEMCQLAHQKCRLEHLMCQLAHISNNLKNSDLSNSDLKIPSSSSRATPALNSLKDAEEKPGGGGIPPKEHTEVGNASPLLRDTPLDGAAASNRLDGENSNMGTGEGEKMGIFDEGLDPDELEERQRGLTKEGMARRKEKKPKGKQGYKKPNQKAFETKKDKEFEKISAAFIMRCKETNQIPIATRVRPEIVKGVKDLVQSLGLDRALEWVRYAVDNWTELRDAEALAGKKFVMEVEPWLHNLTADWRYMEWKRNQDQKDRGETVTPKKILNLSRSMADAGVITPQAEILPYTITSSVSNTTTTKNDG